MLLMIIPLKLAQTPPSQTSLAQLVDLEGKVLLERLCQGGGESVSGWSIGSLGGQAWRRHCLGPGCLWPIEHLKKGN